MVPLADDDLNLLEAVEDLAIEQFVAKLAIEAFAIAVLPGTSRFDVKCLGTDACQPAAPDLGGHLRSMRRNEPEDVSRVLFALFNGVPRWYKDGGRRPAQIADDFLDILAEGLRPRHSVRHP